MKKKVITSLLLTVLLLSQVMPANAATNAITSEAQSKTETSAEVPSELVVPPTLNGITVSIPENLNLTYNESTQKYEAESTISAKGNLVSGYILEVSTPLDVVYDLDGTDVNATVSEFAETKTFGYSNTADAVWTSDELKASTPKERNIKLSTTSDISEKGVSVQKLNFNISLQKIWEKGNGYYVFSSLAGSNNSYGTIQSGNAYITDIYSNDLTLPKYIRNADSSISAINSYNINTSSSGSYPLNESKRSVVTSVTIPYSAYYSFSSNVFPNMRNLTIGNYNGSTISCNTGGSYPLTSLETLTIKYIGKKCKTISCIWATSLNSVTLPAFDWKLYSTNYSYSDSSNFYGCTALTNIYFNGTKDDVKALKVYGRNGGYESTFGDYDFSTISNTNTSLYILSHATWHCTDGDYVPASAT